MPDNRGFAAILPVLLIGGIILATAGTMAARARRQITIDTRHVAGAQALAMADACAEIGVGKLQSIFGYAGNESINANGIVCDILPISGTGMYDRLVTARATVRGVTKTVTVTVDEIGFPIDISSWQ